MRLTLTILVIMIGFTALFGDCAIFDLSEVCCGLVGMGVWSAAIMSLAALWASDVDVQ